MTHWSLGAVIALLLVTLPKIKTLTQYITTLFHEVGHVLASLSTRGGASHIRIRYDTSGDAGTRHQVGIGGSFSRIFTLLSGYATPVNLGFILVLLAFTPWSQIGFWIIVGFSVIALILIRNWFGFLVTFVFAGILALLFYFPGLFTQQQVVLIFGGAILLNGLKDVYQIIPHAWKSEVAEEQKSDFHILAGSTFVSSRTWAVLFLLLEVVVITGIFIGYTFLPITN